MCLLKLVCHLVVFDENVLCLSVTLTPSHFYKIPTKNDIKEANDVYFNCICTKQHTACTHRWKKGILVTFSFTKSQSRLHKCNLTTIWFFPKKMGKQNHRSGLSQLYCVTSCITLLKLLKIFGCIWYKIVFEYFFRLKTPCDKKPTFEIGCCYKITSYCNIFTLYWKENDLLNVIARIKGGSLFLNPFSRLRLQ